MGMDNVPLLAADYPFLRYIHHGKIEHFKYGVICRKYGLDLCHLAQLPVEAFYGIGSIDKPPEFSRILKIGAEISPVVAPGLVMSHLSENRSNVAVAELFIGSSVDFF